MTEQIAAIRSDLDIENCVAWKQIGDRRAAGFDSFGFAPGASQQIGDLLRILSKFDKLAQPIDGKFHANWRRKRKSFCAKRRRSGMSNKIIANRSMPRPNA